MIRFVGASIVAFAISFILVCLIIKINDRLKVSQPILHYVDNHNAKAGTGTFGGVGFILSVLITTILFTTSNNTLAIMCAVVTTAYSLVGFIDDFIKTKSKQNQGLSPIQKLVFQLFISIIVATFAYTQREVADNLIIPFVNVSIKIGWFAIPYYIIIFLSFTNAVNLTDGLDGLASSTSISYLLSTTVIIILVNLQENNTNYNLVIFSLALIFALVGFLFFNSYPAKIFMGDTGSLGLGGAIGCLAVFSKLSLYSVIIGIAFVFTCISDFIQVAVYKKTKKRVFLMAPFHHHLERKGWHENKIVSLYSITTLIIGLICIMLSLVFT